MFSPAVVQTGHSGLSCTGCHREFDLFVAFGRERCHTAFVSALMSPLVTAVVGVMAKGMENGGADAIQGDQTATNVRWSGAIGGEWPRVWRLESERQIGELGLALAAAVAGRTPGCQAVSNGEGWLEPS